MNALTRLIDQALRDPLAHARSHIASGGRVIGWVGADVPLELIVASGALPVVLAPRAEGATQAADRYLEPAFLPAIRSIAQQWLEGAYDGFDAVVFSRADDSTQRLYYYLCELQRRALTRGPRPLLYDLAKIPRAASERHTYEVTRDLAAMLSVDSDAARIGAAIESRNRRRRLFQELARQRASASPPSGVLVHRLLRASDLVPAAAFDDALESWLATDRPSHRGPRLLLVGTAPPDERLALAVHQAGGCVVDEIGGHGLDPLGAPIEVGAEPLQALARHYQTLDYGPRSFVDGAARLTARVHTSRADGAVLWLVEEDEGPAWAVPSLQRAMMEAGVPLLALTRSRWDLSDGALERIGVFVTARGGAA